MQISHLWLRISNNHIVKQYLASFFLLQATQIWIIHVRHPKRYFSIYTRTTSLLFSKRMHRKQTGMDTDRPRWMRDA
jgi:hypothetical protein